MRTLTCPNCGKTFETDNSLQKFCSPECLRIFTNEKRVAKYRAEHPKILVEKTCPICGKKFSTYCIRKVFCSSPCYVKGTRTKSYAAFPMRPIEKKVHRGTKKICKHCLKEFVTSFVGEKFCSDDCRLAYFNV